SRVEVLALCKAMLQVGTAPDFITVDGAEGGTGAAPLEFEDHMGMPLTQGLMTVHNALVGTGLRERVRLGASGKVAAGNDIVKRIIQGADFTNSARAMMMAIGCIQAQRCHTDRCPTGVTTQDPRRQWGLVVEDKSVRVRQYQEGTVAEAVKIMAAMGVSHPSQLQPWMLRRNLSQTANASYATLYEWLEPDELLAEPPEAWAPAWDAATPDAFGSHARTERQPRAGTGPALTRECCRRPGPTIRASSSGPGGGWPRSASAGLPYAGRMTLPVLVDCDTGIDDAFALSYLACRPEVHVTGIVSSAGNVDVHAVHRNNLALAELLRTDAPVSRGAEGPLIQ